MMGQMTVGERLKAAAERVRQGWTQGYYYRAENGGVCAMGAIYVVSVEAESGSSWWIDHTLYDSELEYLVKAIGKVPMRDYLGGPLLRNQIGRWNDAPDQTAENVALALELAAILWEQEQPCAIHRPEPNRDRVDVQAGEVLEIRT